MFAGGIRQVSVAVLAPQFVVQLHRSAISNASEHNDPASVGFRRSGMTQEFKDEPPESPSLTDYDRRQMVTYLRLPDAETDGADWREAVSYLFGPYPARAPQRARRVPETKPPRARRMTEHGSRVHFRARAG